MHLSKSPQAHQLWILSPINKKIKNKKHTHAHVVQEFSVCFHYTTVCALWY